MRKILSILTVLVATVLGTLSPAAAGDFGTPEEAKVMAERAAAFFKANGKDKAFKAFNEGTDGFKDRDLYVFIYNREGVCQAIGLNQAMVGKNLIDMKDADGKPIIRAILDVKDAGWIEYKWRNGVTNEILPKRSYVINLGEYSLGVGAYVFNK
jgi:signal transduction histidine kinase